MTVTFADIQAAQRRIAGQVGRTPTRYSRRLSRLTGPEVWVQLDTRRLTGRSKQPGARNPPRRPQPAQRATSNSGSPATTSSITAGRSTGAEAAGS